MRAEIITYNTKSMNNSKRSIISKRIFGYKDRTKASKYIYERCGILESKPHIKVTRKTFIVNQKDAKELKTMITRLGASVESWKIEINEKEIKKRCG